MWLTVISHGTPALTMETDEAVRPLRLRYRKSHAVLAYLLVERAHWHDRERLASLFWPERDMRAARNNLRQVLKDLADMLKGVLLGELLRIERQRVALFPDPRLRADVFLLTSDCVNALGAINSPPEFAAFLGRAVIRMAALEGEFLAAMEFDEDEFGEWLTRQRATLRLARGSFYRALADCAARCGNGDAALSAAQAWIRVEPLLDEPVRLLMTTLAAAGQRRLALDACADLNQRLDHALGVGAEAATEALRKRLDGDLAGAAPGPPRVNASQEVRRIVLLHVALDGDVDDIEAFERVDDLHTHLTAAIRASCGATLPSLGSAITAAFGLPGETEQPVRRALVAATEMAAGPHCAGARIGLSSGKAVISAAGGAPQVHGHLPTLAMQLALCARPGEIVVSEELARAAPSGRAFAALERRQFQGLKGDFLPYRLQLDRRPPAAVRGRAGDAPCVGRERELAQLHALLGHARDSRQPHALRVIGESGIGKSRLFAELARQSRDGAGATILWVMHRPELRHQPLAALRLALREALGLSDAMRRPRQQARLVRALARGAPLAASTSLPVLAAFLGAAEVAPRNDKLTLLQALIDLLQAAAVNAPLLLLIEDLHWADQAFDELAEAWFAEARTGALLIAMSARPGAASRLAPQATPLALAPLAHAATLALIDQHDTARRLDAAAREQIACRSDGLPLCVEYLARGGGQMDTTSIFATLHQLFDQLGEAKTVLQAASVLGASFDLHGLRALTPAHAIGSALDAAHALAIVEVVKDGRYQFRHALLRDCAYENAPPARLRAWHRAAADYLNTQNPSPSDLAHHLEAAHRWQDAAHAWHRAGEVALAGEFGADALACAMRGLRIARAQPDHIAATLAQRLRLQAGLAGMLAHGLGAADANRHFAALVALPDSEVDPELRFAALAGCYQGSGSQGEAGGLALARTLEAAARTPAQRAVACYALGNSLFWRGAFAEAKLWLERGAAADPAGGGHPRYLSDDPTLLSRAFLVWTRWFLGESDATRAAMELAATARAGARPHAACFALTFAAACHFSANDCDAVARLAGEAAALARRHRFPMWQAVNALLVCWADARRGAPRDAASLRDMIDGMRQVYRSGTTTARWFATRALEAMADTAQLEPLLELTLAEALEHQELYCLPDLLRMRAELMGRQGRADAARRELDQARALARDQGNIGLLRVCEAARLRVGGDEGR